MVEPEENAFEGRVAIVGMAGRFPKSSNIDRFWENLAQKKEMISFFTREESREMGAPESLVNDDHFVRAMGKIEDAEYFDNDFFDMIPREAMWLDPQQRLFLEYSWKAVEDAGIAPRSCEQFIGVFATQSAPTYLSYLMDTGLKPDPSQQVMAHLGQEVSFLASRVAYKLDLRGPCMVIQTACSSSLVCVHQACQSLINCESDVAIAGGASVGYPGIGYYYQEDGVQSPDGHCRAFDERAGGLVPGEGVGVVVLKRLADALKDGDAIRAIIRGGAVNNDGAHRVGFSAPGVDGQAAAIVEALAVADAAPVDVTYVEAHGSGTPLGDLVEIDALNQGFADASGGGEPLEHACPVGSVKSNIGHLDVAAGVAGLIKTVLCLQHKQIAPNVNFHTPNPRIQFERSPYYVNTELADWRVEEGKTRIAGVSSFGMGGTNAHIVLEEAPEIEPSPPDDDARLIVLSAKTGSALETASTRLAEHLRDRGEIGLKDAAYTLQSGREAFPVRRFAVCENKADAVSVLAGRDPARLFTNHARTSDRGVVFMFSGLGDQFVDMGRELWERDPVFHEEMERCSHFLEPLIGLDLATLLHPGEGHGPARGAGVESGPDPFRMMRRSDASGDESSLTLNETRIAHPALFAFDYALARTWISRGVRPKAMIGYSLGEYVAACVSGVFSLGDALTIVARRAGMIQELPQGAMVAAPLGADDLQSFLNDDLSLSCINGRNMSVVSGTVHAVEAFKNEMAMRDVACMPTRAQHAFHSKSMAPVEQTLAREIGRIALNTPDIPFISTVNGRWITADEATDPAYWARQLTSPVRFYEGINALCEDSSDLLLEIGPAGTLTSMAALISLERGDGERPVLSSLPPAYQPGDGHAHFLHTLGRIWLEGCRVDWEEGEAGRTARKVPLPVYPFEKNYFMVEHEDLVVRTTTPSPGVDGPLHRDGDAPAHGRIRETGRPAPRRGTPYAAPRTRLEKEIAAAWEKAFGLHSIGVDDHFFELGGNSLLAIQMLHDLRRRYSLAFSLLDLIRRPTIGQLAAALEQEADAPGDRSDGTPIRDALGNGENEQLADAIMKKLGSIASDVLEIPARRLSVDAAFSEKELNRLLPHFVIAMKEELNFTLHPQDVFTAKSMGALSRHIVREREFLDRSRIPTQEERELLKERIHESFEHAARVLDQRVKAPAPGSETIDPPGKPIVFVLSAGRSGSTLFRVMLAGHPDLFCPPELHLLMHETMGERARGMASGHFGLGLDRALLELRRTSAAAAGGRPVELLDGEEDASTRDVFLRLMDYAHPRILVDKSPPYAASAETLLRAETYFENAKYIHLHRHPYAVMESYIRNRFRALTGLEEIHPFLLAEHHWTTCNHNVLQLLAAVPPERRHTLSFENLVTEPEMSMRHVCDFLQIPYTDSLLKPYDGGRMTDGPGDPNFHRRNEIDPAMAEAWKKADLPSPLTKPSRDIAKQLDYETPRVTVKGR